MIENRFRSPLRATRLGLALAFMLFTGAVQAAGPTQPLSIHTADGRTLPFSVELANTEAQREYGLMNRRSMPETSGMLFDFGSDQQIAMWMKDTLIPLDMVFISDDGTITGIAQRAVPMSETIIPSPGQVRAVLELNGGIADKLRIHAGDKVLNPLFGD